MRTVTKKLTSPQCHQACSPDSFTVKKHKIQNYTKHAGFKESLTSAVKGIADNSNSLVKNAYWPELSTDFDSEVISYRFDPYNVKPSSFLVDDKFYLR